MRRAIRQSAPGAQISRAVSIQAPTGGWDAQSGLANMKPDRAVILDNWIPRPTYIEMRRGCAPQVTGLGAVNSLLTWRGSTDLLLAAVGGDLYNVTNQGPGAGTLLYSAATVDKWQWVNFANDAGTWLIAVNGTDTPIKFDGSTVTTTAITGTSGTITLDPTKLISVMAHKHHLHFIESGTLRVWFLPTDAIAGAAGLLDLGPIFSKGGTLVATATWSFNTGQTLDDFAVYVTNQGQVAIYQGTDPSDATAWSLVGVYDLGYPLSARSLVKYGADLVIITTDGVVPLSQALKLDRSQDNLVAITQRIQGAFQTAAQAYRGVFGWEGIFYQKGALAIINVPAGPSVQYVMNIQNGAWCRFTGLNANCWGIANDAIYFGASDGVYVWDMSPDDNGVGITADVKGAFSAYGDRARQKSFTALRPILFCPGFIQPAVEMDIDYAESVPTATPTVVDPTDTEPEMRYNWSTVSGIGYVGAPRMRLQASGPNVVYIDIDSGAVDTLVTGDGFDLLEEDPIPSGLTVQLMGWDVMLMPGGLI